MQNRPIIIGVTGGSGGGKTSVSRAILSHFPDEKISMIEHDSYYKDQSHLTFEERVKTNYDHPFAFDTDLMIRQIRNCWQDVRWTFQLMTIQSIHEVARPIVRSLRMSLSLRDSGLGGQASARFDGYQDFCGYR